MVKGRAIGIDLGTSFASVAVLQNNKIEMIQDERGNSRMPCVVSFTDSGRLFFEEGKDHLVTNAVNTVYDVNRLISRAIDDPALQRCSRYWPFKLINETNKLKVEVNYENEVKHLYPEEIIAMLLSKVKETAEKYLECEIPNAVITVPACFSYAQRMATFDAAKIAGFNVLRLMNEPTAAAFAYDFTKEASEGEHNVVVFDIGGCTTDFSLFTFEEKILNVKATAGDPNLGGDDFDNRLVDYCLRELNQLHKVNLSRDRRAIGLLKNACERAKRELSSRETVTIHVESICENMDFKTIVTRTIFEEINEELFFRIRKLVERMIVDSKLSLDQVHEVILVGGSTRIPRLQCMIKEIFRKEPNKSLNPEETVASGAAILASMLTGDKSEAIKDLLVLEVSSYTYGIETNGGFMAPVIPRDTTVPTIHKQVFSSYMNPQKDFKMLKEYRLANSQPGVLIDIFEGENRYARENTFLGSIELPIESDFDAIIEVEFDFDVNGVLIVSARDRASGNTSQVKIRKGHFSKTEMYRLIKDAEKYKHDDELEHERLVFKNSFESFCFEVKNFVRDSKTINETDKGQHFSSVDLAIKWLDENEAANIFELENEFRKVAKMASSLVSQPLMDLYKNAYALLGDTKFLFDEAHINEIRERQFQSAKERPHRHHHPHHEH